MGFKNRLGRGVNVDEIDRPGALGQSLIEGADQLHEDRRFEGIEHIDKQRPAGPGELSSVAGGELDLVAFTMRAEPNINIAAALFREAVIHLDTHNSLEGVEGGGHNRAAHTGADIEESVPLERRIRWPQGGAPGVDRQANHGGRARVIADNIEIVSMAGP